MIDTKLINLLISSTTVLTITLSLFLIILTLQPISAHTTNIIPAITLTPTIISKNTKLIAFTLPNLPYDINISREARKKGLQSRDLLKIEKTKYYGDADIRLMQKINVTKQKKESYKCNCTTKLINNKTNSTCNICYKYKNYTVEVMKEIDPKSYILSKNTKIYELKKSGLKIVDLPDGKYGYSIWTNINILGQKLKGLTWWNSSWNYKQPINISNTAGDLTNYQVKIELNSSNFDYTHANDTGKDIRFTNSTDDLIDYFIESWNVSGSSYIWVKVPFLEDATNTTIYMYYGNDEASSTSTTDTYLDYDNFDDNSLDSMWVEYDPSNCGTWTEQNGRLEYTHSANCRSSLTAKTEESSTGSYIIADIEKADYAQIYLDGRTNGSHYISGYYDQGEHSAIYKNDGTGTAYDWNDAPPSGRQNYTFVSYQSGSGIQSLFYFGDTLTNEYNVTEYSTNAENYTGLGMGGTASGTTLFRHFEARKYASPEPTVSNIGSEENNHIKPNLNIQNIYPQNIAIIYEPNVYHTYNISWDNSTQTNCSLYLNEIKNTTQISITQGLHNIAPTNYSHTIYNWYINCTAISSDNATETKQSQTQLVAYANQTGTNEKYLNPFNQTSQSNRLILYSIRQIVYS